MSRTSPRAFFFVALAAFSCSDDKKPQGGPADEEAVRHPVTVAPSADALDAAVELQIALPGAVVEFSPDTGAIARVESAALAGLDEAAMDANPLIEGRGIDEAGEHSALMEYMLRFGHLYGLGEVGAELAVPRDVVNDDALLSQEQFTNGDITGLGSFRARRFVQVHAGVPITGRDVIGFFDAHGGLQSVTTRLLPMDPGFDVTPAFADAYARLDRPSLADGNPALAWLGEDVVIEHAQELSIEMINDQGDLGSEHPGATPRLAYRVHVRGPGVQALVIVDAKTGALIRAIDVMPSDWFSEGVSGVAGANDELGNYVLFLNTEFGSNRLMAVSANSGIPAWLEPGQGVSVSDTTGRANLGLTYPDPLQIAKSVGGVDNFWNNDATYTGGKRQAGKFIASITATFDYWYTRRSWRSWDGQGTTFWASFFNHKNGTTPELNAWGSGGVFQVGDGTTATGQYLGSSLEVSGHELTHNVISATTQLVYQDQSGAVNEALADLFGVAMTADRANNTFSSDYIGDDVGWLLRNMRDPTLTSQPAKYSDYVVTTGDSGGVHTNSGIINKAHALLVQGGTFQLLAVPRVGLSRVEQIVWAAMRFASYGSSATMSEFANGNLAMCSITDGFNKLLGDTSYAATCAAFRKAYIAVELLPRPPLDFTLKAGRVSTGRFNGLIDAKTAATVAGKASYTFTDATGTKLTAPIGTYLSTADRAPLTDVDVGDRFFAGADLPSALLTPSAAARRFAVDLVVDGGGTTTGGPLWLTNDFVPTGLTLTPTASGNDADGDVINRRGTGFVAGLTGAVLARFGGHATFDVFDGLSGSYSIATAQTGAGPVRLLDLATNDSGQYNFANGLFPITVPTATQVPGQPGVYQVWFDAQGGLDVLDNNLQVYVLADSTNLADESDETNNLLCVNCHAPGQSEGTNGVIVRFPKGTATDGLFPLAMRPAAAKLPASYDRIISVPQVVRTRLSYKMSP